MMIESTIRDYLATELTAPVYLEKPKNLPLTYVVIEKTGDSEENRLREATMAIQSVAETLYEAAALSKAVCEALRDAELTNVFGISLNSEYNFTNTTTKERRYQAVFEITYKGE